MIDDSIFESINNWRYECHENWQHSAIYSIFYIACNKISDLESVSNIFAYESLYLKYIYDISEKMLQNPCKILTPQEKKFFQWVYNEQHYKKENQDNKSLVKAVYDVCNDVFNRFLQTNEIQQKLKTDKLAKLQLQCVINENSVHFDNVLQYSNQLALEVKNLLTGLNEITKQL